MGSTLEIFKGEAAYGEGIWALVNIDITPYLGKAQKTNVTLPGRLISKIDKAVAEKSLYGNRSNFLAKAAMRELGIKQHPLFMLTYLPVITIY